MALRQRPQHRAGGVSTHRIQRSIGALVLGTHQAREAREQQQRSLEGQETDQQYKIDIAGAAGVRVKWESVSISFDYDFIQAEDRRDADFDTPFFTYGFEMQSADPVILSAAVKGWHRSRDGVVSGADVWVGAVAPGVKTAVRFRGRLHVVFQGYAQPYVEDDDEVS